MPLEAFNNQTIACAKCGTVVPRMSGVHKFCSSCSIVLGKRRKIEWQNANPREPRDIRHARVIKRASECKEYGRELSQRHAKGQALLPVPPENGASFRFDISFSGSLSKNAIPNLVILRGKPSMFVKKEVQQLRASIAWLVKAALNGSQWPQGKTWLDIVVQKPNHKSDAVNVLDTISDGIKEGLGLDDRWFAVGMLDWEVVKDGGRVFVQVRSEHKEHRELCSNCGQIRPLEAFSKSADATHGVHQVCKVCTRFKTEGKGQTCAEIVS